MSWRPDILAYVRRDCCPCEKRRAGVYGRGPFHLRARHDADDMPSLDVVVEKCPAWTFARSEVRQAEKRIREIDAALGSKDEERSFSSLMAERDNLTAQLRSWGKRMAQLRGWEDAA